MKSNVSSQADQPARPLLLLSLVAISDVQMGRLAPAVTHKQHMGIAASSLTLAARSHLLVFSHGQ